MRARCKDYTINSCNPNCNHVALVGDQTSSRVERNTVTRGLQPSLRMRANRHDAHRVRPRAAVEWKVVTGGLQESLHMRVSALDAHRIMQTLRHDYNERAHGFRNSTMYDEQNQKCIHECESAITGVSNPRTLQR